MGSFGCCASGLDGMGPDAGVVKPDPKIESPKPPSSFLGAAGRWVTLAFELSFPKSMFFMEENNPVDLRSPSFEAQRMAVEANVRRGTKVTPVRAAKREKDVSGEVRHEELPFNIPVRANCPAR